MYKKILVPLDAGQAAQSAARHALELAAEHHAELRFLNVIDVHGFMGPYPNMIEVMSGDAVKMLNTWVEEASRRGVVASSAIGETTVRNTDIAQVIAADASDWGADLIVFGAEAHEGLMSRVLGDMASAVERRGTINTLIVPATDRALG